MALVTRSALWGLAVGLVVSVGAFFLLEHAQTREKTFRFEALANRAVMQLAERVTRFQYGFEGRARSRGGRDARADQPGKLPIATR